MKRDHRGVLAVALDVGSTSIKAARLTADGRLAGLRAVPSPQLTRTGRRCVGDALAYYHAGELLLREVAADLPAGTPLGLTAQRSTFLLWDRSSGRPVTPLISWQDRRAEEWCERHAGARGEIARRCGLVLSPHYIGPKLAVLQEEDAALRPSLRHGAILFGTLETYLAWRWSDGRVHATDASMAARSSLLDLQAEGWSPALLELFGMPPEALPAIQPTCGRNEPLAVGLTLTASVADQAAGALALLGGAPRHAVVNAGTGAFVLRAAGGADERRPGYLTGPLRGLPTGFDRFVHEGTINGPGAARLRRAARPTEMPEADPAPDAFCLPDAAGVGSPHWRADVGFTLSRGACGLDPEKRRRVILEGVLFRSREILDQLFAGDAPSRLILAGGLSRAPACATGLAALLGREVETVTEPEQTLLGAARLAAGIDPQDTPATTPHAAGREGAYLVEKYGRWRVWMEEVLGARERVPAARL
jgi:glycerol kinase